MFNNFCSSVLFYQLKNLSDGLVNHTTLVADDGNRKNFDNYGITTLFKDFASERSNGRYAENACYPLLHVGEPLERIRARIAARAAIVAERLSA